MKMRVKNCLQFLTILLIISLIKINCKKLMNLSMNQEISTKELIKRVPRNNLISFDLLGKSIKVGLEFEMPFVKFPLKRHIDAFGNEHALLNINTAGVLVSGFLAGGGLLVSHLIRNFIFTNISIYEDASNKEKPQVSDSTEDSENSSESQENKKHVSENSWLNIPIARKFVNIFEPIKFVYRNESGNRVELKWENGFEILEKIFTKNNINLVACLQKSVCNLVKKSRDNVIRGSAANSQKIIDGIVDLKLLMNFLERSSWSDTIKVGKSRSTTCDSKYADCVWTEPEKQIAILIKNIVRFT